ncbi:MAG: hypothetical protein HY875_14420 [Chloroflexi bacterium]|nr:hypothetical protein [Chloroflexota bacterium]
MGTDGRARLSRRRLLGAGLAVAAAGTAGAVTIARRGSGPDRVPEAGATASPEPSVTPSPTPDPRVKGGTARLFSPTSFQFDTFDSLRTGEPSVAEVLGRSHSRVITWTDFAQAQLGGDLAAEWEQPDHTTVTIRLVTAARWQERGPLASRAVTADDVVQHFRRAAEDARALKLPLAQRLAEFANIRRVASPAAGQVVFELAQPDPFFLSTLASRFGLVQAPEMVAAYGATFGEARPEMVAGSGSFIYDGNRADGSLGFRAFRAGHRPPLLDGLMVAPPPLATPEAFLGRELDEVLLRDRRDAPRLRSEARGAVEERRFEDSPVISSVFTGAPPWSNPELRRALSGALNRGWLADALFAGRAAPTGPVAPVFGEFGLDAASLASFPGYRAADVDAADARRRWEAAGGAALGPITIDFPSIFDPRYSASSVVAGRLNDVLGGGQFRAAVETYTTIANKVAERQYGNGRPALWFGWGPALADPDPSRTLVEAYGTGDGSLGPIPVSVAGAVVRLAAEFDADRRRALCREVATTALQEGGTGLFDWVLQWSEVFRWPNLAGPSPSPFWGQHLDSGRWLDARA